MPHKYGKKASGMSSKAYTTAMKKEMKKPSMKDMKMDMKKMKK